MLVARPALAKSASRSRLPNHIPSPRPGSERAVESRTRLPRTIILSSHLIDEVANLIEHVVLIDKGRVLIDENTQTILEQAATIVGNAEAVSRFVVGREVLHTESLGRVTSVTVLGEYSAAERATMAAAGIDFLPVSLQQLIVRTTQHMNGSVAGHESWNLEGTHR